MTPHSPHARRPSLGLGGVRQDLRHALRALARRPAFAVIAIVTIALGVGLNTSMFSLANSLLLRPLPFPDADRIVRLYRATPDNLYGEFSTTEYLGLKRDEAPFGLFSAYQRASVTLEGTPALQWMLASSDIFNVLGVQPFRGRMYTAQEDRAGARVAVISYRLWQDRFGGATDIVGRLARTDDGPFEIVGVLPAAAHDHRLFGRVGLFSPLQLGDGIAAAGDQARVGIIGRRAAAVSRNAGDAFVGAVGQRIAAERPNAETRVSWRSEALPLSTTGPTGKLLVGMLIGLATCVLLIACSNLANVLLAAAIERRRESAVRAALGASRLQLVRPLFFESAFLAVAGGLAALLVAAWTSGWLRANLTDAGGIELPTDWRVLAFAATSCAMTLVFVGLAPALFAMRIDPNATLGAGGRTPTSSPRQRRFRHGLIGLQVAFATVLLTGAGLFVTGTAGLLSQDYGWRSDHVLQGNIQVPAGRYRDPASIARFYARASERLQRLPGVDAVSVSYGLPYLGLRGISAYRPEGSADTRRVTAMINGAGPDYFRVTGTRVLSGRTFTAADDLTSSGVAIVSEGMARALYPGQPAVGRRVVTATDAAPISMEIVGVVADARPIDIAQAPNPFQLYQPVAQDPRPSAILALRTAGVAPEAMIAAVRAAVTELDRTVVVRDLSSAESLVGSLASQIYVVRQLLNAFAGLGTLLSLIGIYGVMSWMVAQRTAEIGIRMALGAQVSRVRGLIVGAGLRVALAGAAVGLMGALALSRVIAHGFPGMPTSPAVIVTSVVAGLVGAALGVCWLSARRVSAIDPMTALKTE